MHTHEIELGIITSFIHTITGNKNSYCVAVQWMEATVAQRKVGQEDEVVASE